jgi:DNA modification methylase
MNKIIDENCLTGLRKLDDNSIDCCVTSPPYWGLRDYGNDEQIGREPTPEAFIESLVAVFSEVKRVLKPEGTLWLNLGDTYASGARNRTEDQVNGSTSTITGNKNQLASAIKPNTISEGLKQKDLIGIPWMAAFALRASGWYLRQDIIWHKPNPMPESVTDRCTKSHEYIFLLSKSQKYYYDHVAIMQDVKLSSIERLSQDLDSQLGSERVPNKKNGAMKAVASWKGSTFDSGKTAASLNNGRKNRKERGNHDTNGSNVYIPVSMEGLKANKRSVWTVTTKPFKEAHFATFPETLIVDCIKAGCPENGIVLDPFMGAGTTALVARKLNRNYIGFELNPAYIEIANKRLYNELGIFL